MRAAVLGIIAILAFPASAEAQPEIVKRIRAYIPWVPRMPDLPIIWDSSEDVFLSSQPVGAVLFEGRRRLVRTNGWVRLNRRASGALQLALGNRTIRLSQCDHSRRPRVHCRLP